MPASQSYWEELTGQQNGTACAASVTKCDVSLPALAQRRAEHITPLPYESSSDVSIKRKRKTMLSASGPLPPGQMPDPLACLQPISCLHPSSLDGTFQFKIVSCQHV